MSKPDLAAKWQQHVDAMMRQAKKAKTIAEFRECIRTAFDIERKIRILLNQE